MARVYASNGGFRHPELAGMSGLFGSQARPGMRAGAASLGSLGGGMTMQSLAEPSGTAVSYGMGDIIAEPSGAISRYGMGADAPATTPAATAPAGMSTQTKLLLAGAAVGAWWMFFRKK